MVTNFKRECPSAGGTFFDDKGCPVAGRKTGCEMTRGNTKTHTLWYYGDYTEAAKMGCLQSAEEDPNYVPKVVTPK